MLLAFVLFGHISQLYRFAMSMVEAQRFAFVLGRIEKNWSPERAAAVAWALMPFDDSPVPQRSLEKRIRKRCKALALELRGVIDNEEESVAAALKASRDYVFTAQQKEDSYFVNYWKELESQLSTHIAKH